jgi:hypothetical protein
MDNKTQNEFKKKSISKNKTGAGGGKELLN